MNHTVTEHGYYGNYGGAFIPEMLYANVEELRKIYLSVWQDEDFQTEFRHTLRQFGGRPTPLYFAERLSAQYGMTLYLKREDLCHTGAHKINNTIGQILLAKRMKKNKIIAETGAGQHGVATASVCARMGMACTIYMGAVDVERQQLNVERMKMLGAQVVPVHSGNKTLKDATNEAMRHWINHPDTFYIIGSVVGPHPYPDMVARFQSVISEEIKTQLQALTGTPHPHCVVACVGGGSNAAGGFYHFLQDEKVRLVGVEAAGKGVHTGESAATLALGKAGVLHGSKTILMQTDDGQVIEPYSISAGLDYPGIGPLHAHLFASGRAQYLNVTDDEAMKAGLELANREGIIPAIESAHALAALKKINATQDEIVVIILSGRGDKDMMAYSNFMNTHA